MSVDKCFQRKSHQDKKHDHSGLYTETFDHKYRYRCNCDDCHQNCIWKMADGHQKCIAECIFDGIVKLCKYRIDVKENHQVYDTESNKKNIQYL